MQHHCYGRLNNRIKTDKSKRIFNIVHQDH